MMFQELMVPVNQELDAMRTSLQANSTKLDDIKLLTERCVYLETENP